MKTDCIKQIYDDYISKVKKLEKEAKPSDGLFGMGKKLSDDPCHEEFYDKLSEALADIDTDVEAAEVLEYIYKLPLEYEDDTNIYWMLNAVHGLTHKLAENLSKADAMKILEVYKNDYPRSKRLPVQKQLVRILEKRAK